MNPSDRLDRKLLRESVESLFSMSSAGADSMRIGAELELIPLDEASQRAIPIVSEAGPGSLDVIRTVARRAHWAEIPAGDDPPSWRLSDGGRVSFEPGGQIELSSAPSENPSHLLRDLQCTAQLLAAAYSSTGVVLEASGVDPYNDIADVPLQLHRPRYERMTKYFDSIGPSGRKMMRQTASLQLNVDLGSRPYERWALLNALAPYVTAIFANSPVYAGHATGHQSYRSYFWRTLDAGRTGLAFSRSNPVDFYLQFALGAGAMMRDGDYASFEDWMRTGEPSITDWELHLTTLFPEVRPRSYFEFRSADSISPDNLAAPIAFLAGIVYEDASAREAMDLLAGVETPSLETAGRDGLRNPILRDVSVNLTDIALAGCESLGDAYLSPADVESAADFFDCYTRQGRSPADDRS